MTCAIFIKTYSRDLPWLHYCLRSIKKFCQQYAEVVIVAPEHEKEIQFDPQDARVVHWPETGSGYLFQQWVKMSADTFTAADYILFVDSDCIFVEHNTPDTWWMGAKPFMLITPFSKVEVPWKEATEKALGWPCEYEGMRRLPLLYHREVLRRCRDHMRIQHRMDLQEYIMKQQVFSEFNVLTNFALGRMADNYRWLNTERDPLPPTILKQFRSYDGLTAKTIREMEKVLA